MKLLIIKIGLICIVTSFTIYAQSIIKGKITEYGSGKPVVNANVFILKTLLGSSTSNNGNYEIKDVPEGYFTVVISHINYKTVKKRLSSSNGNTIIMNVELEPKLLQLPEVTVEETEDEEWEENFEMFEKQLLGTGFNAKHCKILNPYSVEFTKTDDGWLKAECNEPIVIDNYALGYKLTYFLEFFETNGYTTKFSGQPHFEEIIPDNGNDKNIYDENRLITYCGSLTHFLKSLVEQFNYLEKQDSVIFEEDTLASQVSLRLNSKLEENGFTVLSASNLPWKSRFTPLYYPVNVAKIISECEGSNYYCLEFKDYLQITYNREWEDDEYLEMLGRYNEAPDYQTSWIKLHKDKVIIDRKGHFFDEFAIETFGYWSFEKLSDMLPFEYEVDDSTLINANWTY